MCEEQFNERNLSCVNRYRSLAKEYVNCLGRQINRPALKGINFIKDLNETHKNQFK